MAELVLSALLPVLFEKLASATLKSIARNKGIDAKIKKWQRSLIQIQGVLTYASHKEITNQSVKRWLNDLQHLAYDIDDVLDDLATEAMHREFIRESKAITNKVRKLIPNFLGGSKHNKFDSITTKLKDLVEERDALGLRVEEETRPKNINRRFQTSVVLASSIIGRQAEKDALVLKLLAVEPCDSNFSIVPIVGMGGVGKTTLAKLLYDEKQVKDHFELKAWVCVTDDFDSFAISKVIFQSVAGVHKEFGDLNLLQVDLRDHLREKRFLLVLDDVWSESYEDWETFVGPFHACAPGSKIIMTTRKERLLKKLGCENLNRLQCLQQDEALTLVAQHALGVSNFDSHLSLKPHGKGIVKKCDGLPLALIALGRLLRTKKNEEEYWKEVLYSEIWSLQDGGGIVPALRLSYHDLSARLKHLFAYCSLFPKGFMFDKNELVVLWMAEGFLNETASNNKIESSGHEYFDELLSRSLFQHAPENKSLFAMHDLMNDLATSVAGEFFLRYDNETGKHIKEKPLENYRHMSFVHEEYVTYKTFETFKRAKSSGTFLALQKSRQHSFLSNKSLIGLLPELPLTKLPKSFLKLKNLCHLDIRDTHLMDHTLSGIGEFKSLQTLSKIIIGGKSGFQITELKELKDLCGKIFIAGLNKVQNAIHAREANFSEKRSELEVEWSDLLDCSQDQMLEKEILNELKPHSDYLEQLKIGSYGGLEFPIWL
ncbi:putative disease resistance RPP13-like protein 1 [Helianthus annuus]|uniref:putative disease resistance RPP13-like protein 1 n=1 Tax=Helianthus annuus TaxID=4232 RepID=UPI0016530C90|nr:putative disease resistance RPP13-like protein 1 [Helianthus annuus]